MDEDRDDFQRNIKGIGKSVTQALYNLGVRTYADLANHSPGTLAELLKSKVAFVSEQRILKDDWIGQARKLAEAQAGASPPSTSEHQTGSAGVRGAGEAPTPPGGWEEVANFFISFGRIRGEEGLSTKSYHSETGNEKVWQGIAVNQLAQWMLDQADLIPSDAIPQKEREPVETPGIQGDIQINLSGLLVSHVPEAVTVAGYATTGSVRVVNRIEFFGSEVPGATYEHAPFVEEIYLFNIETKQTELVASQQSQMAPEVLTYDVQQDFPIPLSGHYQLHILVRSFPPLSAVAQLQGPLIRITS
jgi:hypothetical protein